MLRRLLAAHADVEIVSEAADARATIEGATWHQPDAVFLDIGLDGEDTPVAISALSAPPVIIFTAHDQTAVSPTDVPALDYLHKPFDDARLAQTLDRVRFRLAERKR